MFDLDFFGKDFLAGCDEVGRGPLAGPVVGCCVLVENKYLTKELLIFLSELGVTDSKKLTAKKRQRIIDELSIDFSKLNQKVTISFFNKFQIHYSIREISHTLIDEINILRASILAMSEGFRDCYDGQIDGTLLIDGNKKLNLDLLHVNEQSIVKGDSKSVLIGLASVIAKEYRDLLMEELSLKYPGYGLEKHAGYPTKAHREAIEQLGITPIHRKSFKGVREFCQTSNEVMS